MWFARPALQENNLKFQKLSPLVFTQAFWNSGNVNGMFGDHHYEDGYKRFFCAVENFDFLIEKCVQVGKITVFVRLTWKEHLFSHVDAQNLLKKIAHKIFLWKVFLCKKDCTKCKYPK